MAELRYTCIMKDDLANNAYLNTNPTITTIYADRCYIRNFDNLGMNIIHLAVYYNEWKHCDYLPPYMRYFQFSNKNTRGPPDITQYYDNLPYYITYLITDSHTMPKSPFAYIPIDIFNTLSYNMYINDVYIYYYTIRTEQTDIRVYCYNTKRITAFDDSCIIDIYKLLYLHF
jgi:hypothetical protein